MSGDITAWLDPLPPLSLFVTILLYPPPPQAGDILFEWPLAMHFFFYKNGLYKNSEAPIALNIKINFRTMPDSKYSKHTSKS